MPNFEIDDLSVDEIMDRWPSTIRVFMDLKMHCIGCPIATFHTLADAAREHHLPLDQLSAAITAEIAYPRMRADRARPRRRQAAASTHC